MTVRITVSLPDDLHAGLVRLSAASNVSASATVRAILSDAVPRLTSILDYLGTTPEVTAADVDTADAWLGDLNRVLERAPETFRQAVGDIHFDAPPTKPGPES